MNYKSTKRVQKVQDKREYDGEFGSAEIKKKSGGQKTWESGYGSWSNRTEFISCCRGLINKTLG